MNEHLWNELCECLKWHNKPGKTSIDTLNRLFVEQRSKCVRCNTVNHVILTKSNSGAAKENWTTRQLTERLIPTMRHDRKTPKCEHGPIVVVSLPDHYHIIDGSNRVNKWISANVNGLHEVLVVSYAPESM